MPRLWQGRRPVTGCSLEEYWDSICEKLLLSAYDRTGMLPDALSYEEVSLNCRLDQPVFFPKFNISPLCRFLRAASARFFPHRFLPATPRFFEHGPEEIRVNETSTHQTEVHALSALLCAGPALRQAPTPLLPARVPAGEQGRQPPPLVTQARQPRLLHRSHPCRARPPVAQRPPGLLAPPGRSRSPCVTRCLGVASTTKTTTGCGCDSSGVTRCLLHAPRCVRWPYCATHGPRVPR